MRIDVTVDLSVYPLEAVMGSAYVFVDRCYVLLDKPAEGKVLVSLTGKAGASDEALQGLAGEFQNELLGQALRHEVGRRHERVRELLMARALFGAAPRLAADDAELAGLGGAAGGELPPDAQAALAAAEVPESADYLDDPLGIAVPWEQKFARPAADAAAPAAPGAPAAPAPVPAAPAGGASPAKGGAGDASS